MIWPNVRIADLGTVITGKTPSSKNPEHFGELYPFITPTDIDEGRRVKTERRISAKGFNEFRRQILPRNSICFVCIGATIGKICMTSEFSLTNQQINSIVVDRSKHDPFFVYYLLSTYSQKVKSIAGGAATPIVNKTAFEGVEIPCPPLPTQCKIASILSAYDDLIENNLRRIKILEEMAQNLYREWFVKFRFPGHERVRMVDSPLGKIPEGWDVVRVSDLIEKIKRKRKIKKQDYQLVGEIPVVDQGRDFIGGFTSDLDALHDDPLPIIIFGDHTRILKYIDFPFACGADGTQLLRSDHKRMPMSLLFYVLSAIDLTNYAYARHFKFLKEQEVLLPAEYVATAFSDFANPLRDLIQALTNKMANLSKARDLLLPKLISGEVDVSELDIEVQGSIHEPDV
jgi:type I restriction enzyme S subunit